MQKKHRDVKLGLLIGLLSFSSLSSCVNKRQVLGAQRRHNSYWMNNSGALWVALRGMLLIPFGYLPVFVYLRQYGVVPKNKALGGQLPCAL